MRRLALLLLALAVCVPAQAAAAPKPPRPPVILIVFDEFPTDSLVGRERAHRSRSAIPGFAALAGTSTWFRNHHAVADGTLTSVPSILTSTRPAQHQALPA